MEWFVDMVTRYAYAVILGLQLLLLLAVLRMACSIRRTNRSIAEIRSKVAGYLEVIMEGAADETEEWHKTPKQEEVMRASIESRKKQQQEAVFNAVLKEIFP